MGVSQADEISLSIVVDEPSLHCSFIRLCVWWPCFIISLQPRTPRCTGRQLTLEKDFKLLNDDSNKYQIRQAITDDNNLTFLCI